MHLTMLIDNLHQNLKLKGMFYKHSNGRFRSQNIAFVRFFKYKLPATMKYFYYLFKRTIESFRILSF